MILIDYLELAPGATAAAPELAAPELAAPGLTEPELTAFELCMLELAALEGKVCGFFGDPKYTSRTMNPKKKTNTTEPSTSPRVRFFFF
jgi:hypothetical protein